MEAHLWMLKSGNSMLLCNHSLAKLSDWFFTSWAKMSQESWTRPWLVGLEKIRSIMAISKWKKYGHYYLIFSKIWYLFGLLIFFTMKLPVNFCVLSEGNNWPDYLGNVTYALAHLINVSTTCIRLFSVRIDNGINKHPSQCFKYLKLWL